MFPRPLKKKHFLHGQFPKKKYFPAFSSFLLLAETWKGKKRWKSWLGYFSVHDGNVERKEMLEKLAGLSSQRSAQPSPAATSHISFLSSFPPTSAQAIFHISFLFFPSAGGGGALPLTETWKGKKCWKSWLGYLSVHDGNMERKEKMEIMLGCLPCAAQPSEPRPPKRFSTFLFFPRFHP